MGNETRKVHRYGKSLAVSLPQRICRSGGIKEGDTLSFHGSDGMVFLVGKISTLMMGVFEKHGEQNRSNRRNRAKTY